MPRRMQHDTQTRSPRFRSFRALMGSALLVATGFVVTTAPTVAQAQTVPPLVVGQPAVQKDRLDIGADTACAVLGSGQVACAGGYNVPDGQFSATARTVTSAAIDAVGVQVGNQQGCVRKGSGSVTCWGRTDLLGLGQLSSSTTRNLNGPPAVGLNDVVDVGSGIDYSCGVLASGQARCWGIQSYGLLGNGQTSGTSTVTSTLPQVVLDGATGTALTGVREIDGDGDFACALISDGTVKCWGSNADGKFSPPYGASRADLVRGLITKAELIANISNASSISVGTASACAVIVDGTVKCFGSRNTANFPNVGTTPTPVAVAGVTTARMVAVGIDHACALLADATMTCWGGNDKGQLGRGTVASFINPRLAPAAVVASAGVTLTGIRSIHAHNNDTCAVLLDGTVKCWGANPNGELGIAGVNVSTPTSVPAFSWGGRFNPIAPARILDTRNGIGAAKAKAAAGSITTLQVTGQGGVPATANGVLMNVTVDGAAGDGYVSVYPCSATPPTVSNLNYVTGDTVPNLVAAPLTADGKVCIFTFASTHLIADVSGYYDSTGANYNTLAPSRILNTRDGVGTAAGVVGAGSIVTLQVTGAGGVPANATGVVMNVTVTEGRANGGYVSVYPCTPALPDVSNLNFKNGQTIANLVSTKLSADGKVCLFAAQGTHLLADVAGFYGPIGAVDGLAFAGVPPKRLLDTRSGIGASAGKLTDGQTLRLKVRGVPDGAPATAKSVVLNITAVSPTGDGGYLTVWACDAPQPDASNINYSNGQTIPNLVMSPISSSGEVCIFAFRSTHLLADINGHFRPQ
jgi:alpha-tubulin suppressor-like RCC1 family protein